jgi:hypothetical protein
LLIFSKDNTDVFTVASVAISASLLAFVGVLIWSLRVKRMLRRRYEREHHRKKINGSN